jgi:hypothetical protein
MRRFSLIVCIALLLLLVITFRITTAQTVFICRPGETYGLSGHGPPRTAVLLYFDGTAIGGSTTDAQGSYHVKLVVGREAPGDYALEVQVRATHQVLATALCRVPDPRADESPGSEPAASPESKLASSPTATVVGAPTQPTATVSRATSVATTTSATASATPTTTATPSLTATNLGGMTSTPSTVSVSYSYGGNTGRWCSGVTDLDGAWECDAIVQAAMKDQRVTLTAQVSVNGKTLSEETTMTPVGE